MDGVLYNINNQGQSFGFEEQNPVLFTASTTKVGPSMWKVPLATSTNLAKPNSWYPVQILHVYAKAKASENLYTRQVGAKAYELVDHLGNVTVTVSDLKRELPNLYLATYGVNAPLGVNEKVYAAQVLIYSNYYAFGMAMPGHSMNKADYRFGYQGQEREKELDEEIYSYKYRMNDTRIGRFFSVDPLSNKYPWNSSYAFSENRVIGSIELEGLEAVDVNSGQNKPEFNQDKLSLIKEKDYWPWKDLLQLTTPTSVFAKAQSRYKWTMMNDQPLWKSSGDKLNLDYYSVVIEELPSGFPTVGHLFNYVRLNFGDFKRGGGSKFSAYSEEESEVWNSSSPESAIMHFDVNLKPFGNIEDMNVIAAKVSSNYWVFKPIQTGNLLFNDNQHPLAGYRQFGITSNYADGKFSYTFFTRGIDRPYGVLDVVGEASIFEGADNLWNAVMNNMVNFINSNGGCATVGGKISKRISWEKDVYIYDKVWK